MSSEHFVGDLTLTIAGGALAGWVARKLGLHQILGYIVAGIIFGPFTPGYAAEVDNLAVLSELGLVFLLFTIGLEFSITDIRRIGARPVLLSVGVAAVLVAFAAVAAAVAHQPNVIALGLVLVVSSTAIAIAFLSDAGLSSEAGGKLAISVLIVQDLLAIVILVLLEQPASTFSVLSLLKQLGVTLVFVAIALTVGAAVAKRLVIHTLKNTPEPERVGVFSGIALVAAYLGHLAGLSFAFGAFVAGAVLAETAESPIVERVVAPLRDLFVLCFFVAIGSLIDPALILQNWLVVVALSAVFLIVRWLLWYFFALRCGVKAPTAIVLSIAMLPLGEFTVVLAKAAANSQRLNTTELAIAVGVMFISIVVACLAQPFARRLAKTQADPQPSPVAAK